jgi:hypothetical protein
MKKAWTIQMILHAKRFKNKNYRQQKKMNTTNKKIIQS